MLPPSIDRTCGEAPPLPASAPPPSAQRREDLARRDLLEHRSLGPRPNPHLLQVPPEAPHDRVRGSTCISQRTRHSRLWAKLGKAQDVYHGAADEVEVLHPALQLEEVVPNTLSDTNPRCLQVTLAAAICESGQLQAVAMSFTLMCLNVMGRVARTSLMTARASSPNSRFGKRSVHERINCACAGAPRSIAAAASSNTPSASDFADAPVFIDLGSHYDLCEVVHMRLVSRLLCEG